MDAFFCVCMYACYIWRQVGQVSHYLRLLAPPFFLHGASEGAGWLVVIYSILQPRLITALEVVVVDVAVIGTCLPTYLPTCPFSVLTFFFAS